MVRSGSGRQLSNRPCSHAHTLSSSRIRSMALHSPVSVCDYSELCTVKCSSDSTQPMSPEKKTYIPPSSETIQTKPFPIRGKNRLMYLTVSCRLATCSHIFHFQRIFYAVVCHFLFVLRLVFKEVFGIFLTVLLFCLYCGHRLTWFQRDKACGLTSHLFSGFCVRPRLTTLTDFI